MEYNHFAISGTLIFKLAKVQYEILMAERTRHGEGHCAER